MFLFQNNITKQENLSVKKKYKISFIFGKQCSVFLFLTVSVDVHVLIVFR